MNMISRVWIILKIWTYKSFTDNTHNIDYKTHRCCCSTVAWRRWMRSVSGMPHGNRVKTPASGLTGEPIQSSGLSTISRVVTCSLKTVRHRLISSSPSGLHLCVWRFPLCALWWRADELRQSAKNSNHRLDLSQIEQDFEPSRDGSTRLVRACEDNELGRFGILI